MSWVVADAQKLPVCPFTVVFIIAYTFWHCVPCPQFESNSFDLYTIAFGIRNVPDIPLALSEAYRVLKPGGRLMVLEFRYEGRCCAVWPAACNVFCRLHVTRSSHVTMPGLSNLYDLVSVCLKFCRAGLLHFSRAGVQYSFNVVPLMGQLITQNRDAYQVRVASDCLPRAGTLTHACIHPLSIWWRAFGSFPVRRSLRASSRTPGFLSSSSRT